MRLTIALAAALLAAAPTAALAQLAPAGTPEPSVSAPGRGEARVAPDRATVLLTVETRAASAAAAAAENARRQQSTLDALARLGIPRALLRTAGYSVFPEQRYRENEAPEVVGYVARSTVRAEVRRIDQVGRVIDAALGAGSNAVGGVRFASSQLDAVRRSVLDSAVANGCESATAVARAGGRRIGALLEATIADDGGQFQMQEMDAAAPMMRGAAATPTPINPGELTVTASVVTRWRLVPAGDAGAQQCRVAR